MAQNTQGLYSVFSRPVIYSLFQSAVGALAARRTVIKQYVRPQSGDRILDIGCGPGDIVAYLPAGVRYVGFDESPAYIQAARRRFGQKAAFTCGRVGTKSLAQLGVFDIVLAFAILHHLDDPEALALFRLASASLKSTGRLFTLDGCYTPDQSRWARWVLSNDRGKNVRTREEYVRLATTVFPNVSAIVRHDMLSIPTTVLVLQCRA